MRSAILTYHSLDDSNSVISTPASRFRTHMRILADSGVPVVPLEKLVTTPGAVALTFDDGFRNFLTDALPVLAEHRFPATVFAVTGHCGRKNDWPGQSSRVPILDLLSEQQIRTIHREGVAVGSHTHSHPSLDELGEKEAAREMEESRQRLEEITGDRVELFAYPYGRTSAFARRLAGQYFRYACGTTLRYVDGRSDPLDLPRLDAYYLQQPPVFRRLFDPQGRWYLRLCRLLRETRQWISR